MRRRSRYLLPLLAILLLHLCTRQPPLITANDPLSATAIHSILRKLSLTCATPASFSTYGKSQRGRPLPLLRLTAPAATHTILLTSALHGREFQAPLATLLALETLCRTPHSLRNISLVVAPLANPDGYERARTIARPARKTWPISQTACKPPRTDGVDLNRNFPVAWTTGNDPCSATHAGHAALSEPEAAALAALLHDMRPFAHLDVHSFAGILFRGRAAGVAGTSDGAQANALAVQRRIARAARIAVRKAVGTEYDDWSASVDPLTGRERSIGGTLMDYASSLGVPSVVMELGPKWSMQNRADGFFEGKNMASQRAREVRAVVDVLLDAARGHLPAVTDVQLGKLHP